MTFLIVAFIIFWLWTCLCIRIGYRMGVSVEGLRWETMRYRDRMRREAEERYRTDVPVIINDSRIEPWNQ